MRQLVLVSTPSGRSPTTCSFPHHLIPRQALDPYASPTYSLSLRCSHDLYHPLGTQVNHHLFLDTLSVYASETAPLLLTLYLQAQLCFSHG